MKLTSLPSVGALVTRRQALEAMADAAELGLIDVVVAGKFADDNVKAVCLPVVAAECRAQMAAIDRELEALGVEVD